MAQDDTLSAIGNLEVTVPHVGCDFLEKHQHSAKAETTMMNMSSVVLLTSVSFLFACENSGKSTDPTPNNTDTSAVIADTAVSDAAGDDANVDAGGEDAAEPNSTDVSTTKLAIFRSGSRSQAVSRTQRTRVRGRR